MNCVVTGPDKAPIDGKIEVVLSHPCVGNVETMAKDISTAMWANLPFKASYEHPYPSAYSTCIDNDMVTSWCAADGAGKEACEHLGDSSIAHKESGHPPRTSYPDTVTEVSCSYMACSDCTTD